VPKKIIIRLEQIDCLIYKKSTGNPKVFASKLGISESTLYEYLNELKELGAPILYNKFKETYFYYEEGNLKIKFEKKSTPD
jgi:predicted DNA-binding transcriptional regulator YafY